MQREPPPHDNVLLEEVDLTYPKDVVGSSHDAGSSQGAGSSQYQSHLLPERRMTASYFRKRWSRPSKLERVQEEDEH